MQVSSIETAPGAGSGKEATKPSQAASDAFAILLQSALTQNPAVSKLKISGESGLAEHFSANSRPVTEAPEPTERDDYNADTAAGAGEDPDYEAPDAAAQPVQDGNNAGRGEAENLAALTDATEVQISLSRTQAGSTVAAAQDRPAAQSAATANASVTASAASAAQNAPELKAPANGSSKPDGETGANTNRATAQVTEASQTLVSRPANTLSAAATLSAQAGSQEKTAPSTTAQTGSANAESATNAQKTGPLANGEAGRNSGTPRLTENSGNLLLNAGDAKVAAGNAGRTGQQAAQYTQTAQNGPATNASALQQAAAPVQPAPPPPVQPAATGRQAPVVERVGSLPASEPTPTVGAGPAGTSAPAPASRVAAPIPARPAAPPSDLKEQVSVQVQKAIEQGIDRIRIQLKPADLGRLEIQLDVAQDGKVAIVVNADRPETLEMLRRDARGLQQALQDAGLQTDSGGMSFNLGGGNASFGDQLADSGRPASGPASPADTGDANSDAPDTNHHRRSSDSKIDVEV